MQKLVLAFLAIVFTLALTFATLELPMVLNRILVAYFTDVPTDVLRRGWEPRSVELLMNYARPVGYVSLAVVIVLIAVGFATKRRILSSLGSFAFFIPAFGYFAASMFFLAGIGILRVMWLPFWDTSPLLLRLGDVAYLPYWMATFAFNAVLDPGRAYQADIFLAYLIVGAGLLAFMVGAFSWLYGKLERRKVFDLWIYKYSRHPQYLGFIVWSYGVMLLTRLAPNPFCQPEPSFPWLISTLLIICVALTEEIAMIKRADESYLQYRTGTPFMLPLPRFLSKISTAPNRTVMKKDFPERGREVLYTFVIYCAMLVLLSTPILASDQSFLKLRLC